MPLACFDTETTGPIPTECRLVTAFIGKIDGSEVIQQNWMVDPGIEIPEGAAEVHGVTTEIAQRDGMDYKSGYAAIRDALTDCWEEGRIIAAYNASFDFTLMDYEGRRLGWESMEFGPIVDPYVLDREHDKYRKGKRTLGVTAEHYGLSLKNAHTADADALAAARLAWKFGRREDLAGLTAEELMAKQGEWHLARQEDFKKYLVKKATSAEKRIKKMHEQIEQLTADAAEAREKSLTVNGDWPIRKVEDVHRED